jgi:capsular exopolysaccharide synthesis family protein
MSQIDKALKRALGTPVSGEIAPLTDPAARFTLDQYPQERPTLSPERASLVGVEPPSLASFAPASRGRLAQVEPGSEVRLVAGTTPDLLEQYHRIVEVLRDAQAERGLNTVMVTSAKAREGRTHTAVNLALLLSESYARRVLLIDADLRQPAVHEMLGLRNEAGLTDALHSGRHDLSVKVSPLLSVMPAGIPERHPLRALASERMGALLDDCAARFDWILLDTPPVGLLSETRLLANRAQGVLFVIDATATPFPVVEKAIAALGRQRIVATVLNRLGDRPEASRESDLSG